MGFKHYRESLSTCSNPQRICVGGGGSLSWLLAHLGDPVVVVSAPVDPVLEELDALEEVVLEGGGLARREDVHAGERRGDEVQPVVGQVQAVVLPLLDDVLEHLIITENTHT